MAIGFKSGTGGTNPLNFKVVGGTTEPNNVKENTIWINTDQKITAWMFSSTEPSAPLDGMVWIKTGASSPVAFNALKKNGIQVYPIFAKQYVSGAWVDKTAKSYQGGEWVDWIIYLCRDGVLLAPYTMLNGAGFSDGAVSYWDGEKTGVGIQIEADSTSSDTVNIDINLANAGLYNNVTIGVYDIQNNAVTTKNYHFESSSDIISTDEKFSLDISKVSGKVFVVINISSGKGGNAGSIKINEIYCS